MGGCRMWFEMCNKKKTLLGKKSGCEHKDNRSMTRSPNRDSTLNSIVQYTYDTLVCLGLLIYFVNPEHVICEVQ